MYYRQAFGLTFASRRGAFAIFVFATFIKNGKKFKTQNKIKIKKQTFKFYYFLNLVLGTFGVMIFLLFTYTRLPHVGLTLHSILIPSLQSISQYISLPCFHLHMFTTSILMHVFHTCYLHAFLLLTYYMPCKHGLFVYKPICRPSLFFS